LERNHDSICTTDLMKRRASEDGVSYPEHIPCCSSIASDTCRRLRTSRKNLRSGPTHAASGVEPLRFPGLKIKIPPV
jgi:hypothetical protein